MGPSPEKLSLNLFETPNPVKLADQVAASQVFSRSKRHAALLQFLAAEAGSELKEVIIGHRFFERPADYDPKADPVVRVEMRRLRERLDEYYRNGGSADPWRIEVPKGSYRVAIVPNPNAPSVEPPAPADEPPARAALPTRPMRFWPIAAAIVAIAGIALAIFLRTQSATPPLKSIAVIELQNLGGISDEMRFGLEAEIAAALTSIGDLLVIGPSASARVHAAKERQDAREVAAALHVDAVLGGTLEARGSRVRLQMNLTRGSDGAVLWAQSEERNVVDPFALQSEFAARLAGAVNLKLLHRPGPARTVSNEALMDFRRGALQVERRTGPSILRGIAFFQSAVAKDPEYAAAWAALAEACAMMPDYQLNFEEWAPRAREAAARALQLDPSNADAHSTLGWVDFFQDLRIADARKSLLRALSLNPNHLTTYRRLGLLYTTVERFEEAEQALQAALRLDPLSQIAHINQAELYFAKGDYKAEERELRGILAANPSYELALIMLAVNLSLTHQCDEAVRYARPLLDNPEASEWWATMVTVMARCGDVGPARSLSARDQPPGTADILSVYVGDWRRARKYFAKAVERRPLRAVNMALDPAWLADPEIRQRWEGLRERLLAADGAQ